MPYIRFGFFIFSPWYGVFSTSKLNSILCTCTHVTYQLMSLQFAHRIHQTKVVAWVKASKGRNNGNSNQKWNIRCSFKFFQRKKKNYTEFSPAAIARNRWRGQRGRKQERLPSIFGWCDAHEEKICVSLCIRVSVNSVGCLLADWLAGLHAWVFIWFFISTFFFMLLFHLKSPTWCPYILGLTVRPIRFSNVHSKHIIYTCTSATTTSRLLYCYRRRRLWMWRCAPRKICSGESR